MNFPKIKNVKASDDYKLEITFENGIVKIYDCKPLLADESFKPLEDKILFKNVSTDKFGYGIIWSEHLDLSESELWINGKSV